MSKKITGRVLCLLLLALSNPTTAQQEKLPRIGVLFPGGPMTETIDGLKQGLKDAGLEAAKQFTLSIKDTKGDNKIGEQAAKEFERDRVNVLYVIGSTIVAAAKDATTNVPIVFCTGNDPVAMGLIKDFAKPGGRLTGVHYLVKELTAKRLQIFKELVPKLNRVVTFYDPGNSVATESVMLAREEAKRLGLKLIEHQVGSIEELRSGLKELKGGDGEAFFYVPDTMIVGQAQQILQTAAAKKMATMFQDESLVSKGALASYGQNYFEIGRLSAKFVQRVLNGTPPNDLRVETADNVELVINLQTAKQLGLNIPAQVLARAKRVIR